MILYALYLLYTTANVVYITSNSSHDDNLQHSGMLDIRVGTCIVRLVNACLPLLGYSCAKVTISINNVDIQCIWVFV